MANSWNKPVTPKKPKKPSTPPPVHKRRTVDMSRLRKARIVATEIRKAQKKIAKREEYVRRVMNDVPVEPPPDMIEEKIKRCGSIRKLRAHIARLKGMQERLERKLPGEVRTARDYARRKPVGYSVSLREAMQIKATTAPAASPSSDEVATVSDPAPVQS